MTKPYVRLDKNQAVVLLVDHQTGLLSLVRDIDPDKFKNNVLAVADLAKYFKLPTILTTSSRTAPTAPLFQSSNRPFPMRPSSHAPVRSTRGTTRFRQGCEATGREQLIIAGVVTEVCVAFPALSAIAEGYEVFVVTDASGTFDEITRHSAWNRMSEAGAQL